MVCVYWILSRVMRDVIFRTVVLTIHYLQERIVQGDLQLASQTISMRIRWTVFPGHRKRSSAYWHLGIVSTVCPHCMHRLQDIAFQCESRGKATYGVILMDTSLKTCSKPSSWSCNKLSAMPELPSGYSKEAKFLKAQFFEQVEVEVRKVSAKS